MIEVRGAEPNDLNFIMSTWLRGLRHGNDYFASMESDSYYASKKEEVTAILCRPDVSVRVACAADDRELILGYLVAQIDDSGVSIVWAWVRPAARQQGIAKQLCQGLRVRSVSNVTKMVDSIIKRKNWTFCPVVIQWSKNE